MLKNKSKNRCVEAAEGQECSRYGNTPGAIPIGEWRVAAGLIVVGLGLLWLVFVLSVFSCLVFELQKKTRYLVPLATLLMVSGLLTFAGGFSDVAINGVPDTSRCQVENQKQIKKNSKQERKKK